MDSGILGLVSSRLEADGSGDEAWATLVLAALGGTVRVSRERSAEVVRPGWQVAPLTGQRA